LYDILAVGKDPENRAGTEELPIYLQDDTCEEFRALCWILYALYVAYISCFGKYLYADIFSIRPDETKSQSDRETLPLDDISRLLSLALLSHKYDFTSFEAWARNVLDKHCFNSFPDHCSEHDVKRLVHYYSLVGDKTILDIILKAILKSLDRERPVLSSWLRKRNVARSSSDPDRPLDLVEMLCLGEAHEWRDLQGHVYYRLLCDAVEPSANAQAKPVFSASTLLSLALGPKGLSVQQRSNLLQGFISIMAAWDRITRLAFDKAVNCTCFVFIQCGVHRQEVWSELLGEACKRFSAADILERIAYMNAKRTSVSKLILVGWTCRPKLAAYMTSLEEEIEDSIPNYFLGENRENQVLLTIENS